MERRLSAILAADVVGYSRLMEDDEVGTLERLKALREKLIDPLVARHKGRVVKLMGDGLLLEFQSVVEAVECAVAWQRGAGEGQADLGPDKALRYRIGINLGDVIVEGEDIYGDGVNVAARLEGLAEPGGICASRSVFEQIKNRLDLDHVDLGELAVKNIAEPVHAYRIQSRQAATGAPPRLEEARGSIAVFPFDSLSPDPEDAYLADGIAMEIISLLSRIPDLRVASRPATFGHRGDDIWAVVRDLQLRYVLTGSVRRAGQHVAQLQVAHHGPDVIAAVAEGGRPRGDPQIGNP